MLCGFRDEPLVLQGCTGGFFLPVVQLQCLLTGELVGTVAVCLSEALQAVLSSFWSTLENAACPSPTPCLFPDWCLFLLCTHKQYLGNLVAQRLEVILLEVCQRNEWPYPNGLSEKMRTSFGWRLSSVSGTHKQVMCCHTLFQSAKLKQFLQLLFLILVTLCYIWGLNLVIFNVLSS